MKKLKLSPALFILLLLSSTVYGQSSFLKNPLSLSLQSGFTIHTDYLFNEEYNLDGIGINYFEGGIYYRFSEKIELGATIGRDEFKVKNTRTDISVSSQQDTTYSTYTYTSLLPYTWFAGNINYYFNENLLAGIKAGADQYALFFSANVGAQLLNTDQWGLNGIFQVFSRFDDDRSQNNTYQINLLFNVRFKVDFSNF